MATDPLSLLREFTISKKKIISKDGNIIFDNFFFNKTAKTNYIIYKSQPYEYYTLETVLFLIENQTLSHAAYVQQAASLGIPNVRYPDRMDLLGYLTGKQDTSSNLDVSIPLENPQVLTTKTVKRHVEPLPEPRISLSLSSDADILSMKLSNKKEAVITTDDLSTQSGLNEIMSIDKIAQLKRKRLAHKQTAIQDPNAAGPSVDSASTEIFEVDTLSSKLVKDELKFISSELGCPLAVVRTTRNRSSILESVSKNLSGVNMVLNSVKEFAVTNCNDTGLAVSNESKHNNSSDSSNHQSKEAKKIQSTAVYNRYEQEQFKKKEDTAGFKIDTFSSYHGLISKKKNETDESASKKIEEGHSSNAIQDRFISPSAPKVIKRESKTPIIVLPSASSCCIGLSNIADFLQNYSFISVDEKRRVSMASSSASGNQGNVSRETEVFIHRKRELTMNGQTQTVNIPYRCIDNITMLKTSDWNRVVAVFVHGPLWQFKGWPWLLSDGSPSQIFQKVCAFHVKYHDVPPDQNISKWDVQILEINRSKRYMDRACALKFWENLEKFITKNKPFLRY